MLARTALASLSSSDVIVTSCDVIVTLDMEARQESTSIGVSWFHSRSSVLSRFVKSEGSLPLSSSSEFIIIITIITIVTHADGSREEWGVLTGVCAYVCLSGTWPFVQTVSDVCLKLTCSIDTNAFSALEVLDDNRIALYKFTHSLTYLLTYLFAWYLKNRCSYDQQMWPRNVPSWVLKTHLFLGQKVKGRGHKSQQVSMSVLRQNAILPLSAYVSHAGFSPLQCTAAQAMTATSDFPASLSRHQCCCWPPVLPCMEFFAVSQRQKNIADVGHSTHVSAGFF